MRVGKVEGNEEYLRETIAGGKLSGREIDGEIDLTPWFDLAEK